MSAGQPVRRLHAIPNYAVIAFLGARLPPGADGIFTERYCPEIVQRFRVATARALAVFPPSPIGRLVRHVPGVRNLLFARDEARRDQASMKLRIDYVSVGNNQYLLAEIAELPPLYYGSELSVRVTNTSAQPLEVRVLVDGVLS